MEQRYSGRPCPWPCRVAPHLAGLMHARQLGQGRHPSADRLEKRWRHEEGGERRLGSLLRRWVVAGASHLSRPLLHVIGMTYEKIHCVCPLAPEQQHEATWGLRARWTDR